jgi:hypothetical protein
VAWLGGIYQVHKISIDIRNLLPNGVGIGKDVQLVVETVLGDCVGLGNWFWYTIDLKWLVMLK